jgi:hypothetical protein
MLYFSAALVEGVKNSGIYSAAIEAKPYIVQDKKGNLNFDVELFEFDSGMKDGAKSLETKSKKVDFDRTLRKEVASPIHKELVTCFSKKPKDSILRAIAIKFAVLYPEASKSCRVLNGKSLSASILFFK